MKEWKTPVRNWKGIQFEVLRRQVDPKFNQAHDVLSKAYYEGKPLVWKGKDWGILDKETFDKLHGLIFHQRTIAFHVANMKLPQSERILEAEYNDVLDVKGSVILRHTSEATKAIKNLKLQGIELEM